MNRVDHNRRWLRQTDPVLRLKTLGTTTYCVETSICPRSKVCFIIARYRVTALHIVAFSCHCLSLNSKHVLQAELCRLIFWTYVTLKISNVNFYNSFRSVLSMYQSRMVYKSKYYSSSTKGWNICIGRGTIVSTGVRESYQNQNCFVLCYWQLYRNICTWQPFHCWPVTMHSAHKRNWQPRLKSRAQILRHLFYLI